MEDDDSSSSLNPSTAFPSVEKVQRGVVTTTTEDEGDETSSQSNSNNEVLAVRPEPVSSANTTTDSLTGTGDPDVGCSPTSTGLNSTTEDADVEDNSSPRSGERITTSSSSSSDGYNFDERPHSQRDEKNSSQDSSEKMWLSGTGPRNNHTNPPGSGSFKFARTPTVFSPFTRSEVSVGNQYSSSSSQVSFSNVTPNPFALARPVPGGPISHIPNSSLSSLYHHDTLATSRSLGGPARNAAPFASESKPILRPSSLLAPSCLTASASAVTSTPFSGLRNPFGSTTSSSNSNSSVSSSSYFNNPFNSASTYGKQDELVGGNGKAPGQLFGGASNSTVPEDVASTTSSFVESSVSVKAAGSTSILRQSKLSNVHYPCTSSENSEARYSGGNVDSTQGEYVPNLRQQPSTSTISSEAAAKLSIPNNLVSAGVTSDNTPPTLFQSISSSAGHTFSQPLAPHPVATTSENFVFGSNIGDRVVGGSINTNSERSPESSATLPNGVSSTSSSVGILSSVASTFGSSASAQVVQTELASAGGPMVDSSTEDDQFQSNTVTLGQATEPCFASSSTAGDRKRKFSDQVVTTGEENESNVLSTSCRLFVFDGTSSTWVERGRGQLRLNDRGEGDHPGRSGCGRNDAACDDEEDDLFEPMQSRIIVRTKGSLRLMLNTHVWSGMKVEKPSEKSVRFTANDNGTIKIFVVQSTPNDADLLFSALDCRVQRLMSYEASNLSASSYLPLAQGEVSHQSSSTYPHSGTMTPPTSAFGASGIVDKRDEVDSSEFDDSDEEDAAEKSEDDDSPHKKKRLDNEGPSETPSPSTTTNECTEEVHMSSVIPQELRTNIVPSIQVDKPETRSDDEDEED